MLGLDDDMDDATQRLLWGLFVRGVACVAIIFFLGLRRQIAPWAGPRGVHPAATVTALRKQYFTAWRRFAWSPGQLVFELLLTPTDRALEGLTLAGAVSAVWLIVFGHGCALWGVLAAYLSLVEAAYAFWPWHCLLGEVQWVLLLSGSTSLEALPSLVSTHVPSGHTLFAATWLAFRVLFGFGKMKFAESTWRDRMYLRSFMVNLPLPTPVGVWCHFHLPRWCFIAGYVVYFASEIVAPFLFFFPMPWRGVAALSLVGLMLGIQVTGNFGFFNLLTALFALPLMMPSGPWWAWPTGLGDTLVLMQAFVAAPLLAFNSWIASSWFSWPYVRRASPLLSDVYGTLSAWRVMVPYGVFPPRTFTSTRRLPYFEVSDDGKSWRRLQYRYQRCGFTFGHHPILDIWAHYVVGMGGYIGSILNGLHPFFTATHVYASVVRNLLTHGTCRALFRDEDPNAPLPRFARMVRVVILPDERTGQLVELASLTVEIPSVSLHDVEMSPDLLPEPVAPTLDDCDVSLAVFRQCSPLYQSQLAIELAEYFGGSSVAPLDVVVGMTSAATAEEAATFRDTLRGRIGAVKLRDLQRALSRRAFALLNAVEDELYTKKGVFDRSTTHAILYLACLAHAIHFVPWTPNKEALIASIRDTVANGLECVTMRVGLHAFVFMHATLLRRECLHARDCAFYGSGYHHILPSAVSLLESLTYVLAWTHDEVDIVERFEQNEWIYERCRVVRRQVTVID